MGMAPAALTHSTSAFLVCQSSRREHTAWGTGSFSPFGSSTGLKADLGPHWPESVHSAE